MQWATRRGYVQRPRRKTVSFGNSTSTAYGYNSRGALESIAHDLAGTANDVSFDFLHNHASEITTRNLSNNRFAWTPTKAANRTLEVNGLNQVTKITTAGFAPQDVAHDDAGNLRGDGITLFTYDLDNKLRSSQETQAGGVLARNATLSYDAEGRLTKEDGGLTPTSKSVTHFLYDGSDLIAEYNAEGTLVRRYVHGPGVDEPVVALSYGTTGSSKEWVYADQLGSVVATANAAGDASSQQGYGPFGEPNQTGGLRFKYTGQTFMPNVGLYYYKARFYSAELGRFLQTDPLGYGDGTNLYGYVAADPINSNDPTGEFANLLFGGGSSVLLGGAIRYVTSGGNWSQVFDAKSMALDFAAGAVGVGIANKAQAVWAARSLPTTLGSKLAAQTSQKYETGLYVAQSSAGKYVGQSGQITTRLEQYVANARFGSGSAQSANDAMRLSVAGGKTSREVAEQRVLNSWGGARAEGVLNRVSPVGGRPSLLSNESLGSIGGIYVTPLGIGSSSLIGAAIGAGK